MFFKQYFALFNDNIII